MEWVDLLPSLALTVLFLIILSLGDEAWFKADTFLSTVFAFVGVFAPGALLQTQTSGELDKTHKHLYRMFGVTLLSTCLFAHFTKNSRDAVIKTTILWGRVIGLSIYILTRCHSYFTVTCSSTCKWNEKALYFGIYGDGLWFLGNLVYAVKSSSQGERAKILYGRLEGHLVTDFIFTFLFALSFYVFPGHMLGFQAKIKLDKMHASITRLMAAILFNSTFIAGCSSRFTSKDDKLAFLLSRIIGIIGYILSQIYAQLTTDNWTHWHVYFGMLGMTVWLVNAVAGYMYGRQKEQTHTE